jgi:hypothetical protein
MKESLKKQASKQFELKMHSRRMCQVQIPVCICDINTLFSDTERYQFFWNKRSPQHLQPQFSCRLILLRWRSYVLLRQNKMTMVNLYGRKQPIQQGQ